MVMETLTKILHEYTNGLDPTTPTHPGLATAVEAQQRIGIHLLPRGFMATKWTDVLEEFLIDNPERKISCLLRMMWLDFTEQLWKCRNAVAHKHKNLNEQAKEETWAARLLWFLVNPHVLAAADRFLLDYEEADIQGMTGYVRKRRVQQLERVMKTYANERTLRTRGQSVITQFFKQKLKGANEVNTTEIGN